MILFPHDNYVGVHPMLCAVVSFEGDCSGDVESVCFWSYGQDLAGGLLMPVEGPNLPLFAMEVSCCRRYMYRKHQLRFCFWG